MDIFNLHISSIILSEDYMGAEPVDRATWLNLVCWCCTQENGGVIKDAKSWSDRKWQQLCGVTEKEVTAKTALFAFDGDDLTVGFYPAEAEAICIMKREVGRKGGGSKSLKKTLAAKANGAKGGRPKKSEVTESEADGKPKQNPSKNPSETQAKTQGKEREGKGREEADSDLFLEQEEEPENERFLACQGYAGIEHPSLAAFAYCIDTCSEVYAASSRDWGNYDVQTALLDRLDLSRKTFDMLDGWKALRWQMLEAQKEDGGKFLPSRKNLLANFSERMAKASMAWEAAGKPVCGFVKIDKPERSAA